MTAKHETASRALARVLRAEGRRAGMRPAVVGPGRQEIHFVLRRKTHHFGNVGQVVELMEKGLQFSGRRDPEQRPRRLVGLVEVAVGDPARQTDEVAGVRLHPDAVEFEVQHAFLHQDEFLLSGMNVNRHELSRLAVRLEGESRVGRRFRKIHLAENVQLFAAKAFAVARNAFFEFAHGSIPPLPRPENAGASPSLRRPKLSCRFTLGKPSEGFYGCPLHGRPPHGVTR